MKTTFSIAIVSALLTLFAFGTETAAKTPILLDCDLGDDIDDAFALALVLASPELELRGVTTVFGDAYTRALIACRFLHLAGKSEIPVASGSPPRTRPELAGQFQYGLRPAFGKRPVKESAVEFLYSQLKANPGDITVVAIGPLTNIAELLTLHPDCKPWIGRLVLMAGSVRVGYEDRSPPEVEWNVRCDIRAAQIVLASGVPLVVAPLDATTSLKLEEPLRRRLFDAGTPLTNQVHALYQLWDKPTPTLFDPVAVTLCFEEKFCKMEDLRLEVERTGMTREVKGKPNARVATSIQREAFLQWYVERVRSTMPPAPAAPREERTGKIVPRGNMPQRIHVVEDYETDIERRWWLAGKLETKNVPPGSSRACRGVLTNDFDDRMGEPRAMYQAVIFNPVPGPPMGKNTRLAFRYWLHGTDTLRVQIYSLSKGYHRQLTLRDLPQGRWQDAAVDMTELRRPDGSGGPLAEEERIDDIQFYTAAAAELIIDDIILYDAAPPEEPRPFPARPIFTGWFDTGAQGKEWPGNFEIVAKDKPLTGKTARSVAMPKPGLPWVRIHLRGERPLGESTHLAFRYRLKDCTSMQVVLVHWATREAHVLDVKELKRDAWGEATLDFGRAAQPPKKGERVDEIHFILPAGGELLVDDVLLYEPGKGS